MACIRIVDTSVLCNLLRVPNMDQDGDRAADEFRAALHAGDVLLLPVAVIFETGNHIAQNGDGGRRRAVASAFAELVEKAFTGEIPFTPTPLQNPDDMLAWLSEFPDHAIRGIGFADLSITKVFTQQCELNQARRVMIWSYDRHLASFDQPARI
jgi:predicted nucleic acid-binding protein